MCCSSWDLKEWDTTEPLNWTEGLLWNIGSGCCKALRKAPTSLWGSNVILLKILVYPFLCCPGGSPGRTSCLLFHAPVAFSSFSYESIYQVGLRFFFLEVSLPWLSWELSHEHQCANFISASLVPGTESDEQQSTSHAYRKWGIPVLVVFFPWNLLIL